MIEIAGHMRRNAHAPYSSYRVGAALLTESDDVYGGCNVENASFGLTICAERTAVVKAVSDGETSFRALVVVTDDGASPCGACRQFMAEFAPDMPVYMARPDGRYTSATVTELLPQAFDGSSVKRKRPKKA